MAVYRLTATNNDNQSLNPARDKLPLGSQDPRLQVGPSIQSDWSPPPLVHFFGKTHFDADFWSYDHDMAFAVSSRVADVLAHVDWCELVPFTVECLDPKGKVGITVSKTLLAVTRVLDAIDATHTRFKPYGDQVLDFDNPGAIAFVPELLPASGLFLHRSGATYVILCAEIEGSKEEPFRSLVQANGWTGLTFREVV